MKIKTVKKMNLPELIQHVWDNKDYPNRFVNNFNGEVVFNDSGKFMTDDSFISHNSLFTVEVEEELTEDTEIHGASFVYYNELKLEVDTHRYEDATPRKLKHIIRPSLYPVPLAVFRGKQLIWTKEHGIPEEGVIEL